MPTTRSDIEDKLLREQRARIAHDLRELRSVLTDLTSRSLPQDATVEQRRDHFTAVERAKARIHELDLEYVALV